MRAEGTGLGSGLSDLQKDSFLQVIRYDATNLQETLTNDLLTPLQQFNYPKYRAHKFFLRLATESAVPLDKLQALQAIWAMGGKIRTSDAMAMVGCGAAMVVGGEEGLDELSIEGASVVAALLGVMYAAASLPPRLPGARPSRASPPRTTVWRRNLSASTACASPTRRSSPEGVAAAAAISASAKPSTKNRLSTAAL
jgi:hypothetical protein